MYFQVKNTLKNNRYHNIKYCLGKMKKALNFSGNGAMFMLAANMFCT